MTNKMKLLVRVLVVINLISGFLLAKRAFAEDYKELSHQYNLVYADLLIKKINTLSIGSYVVLSFKDGSQVDGYFKGFEKYDDKIWIKKNGHWLSDAYSVRQLQDVSVGINGKV